MVILAAGLTPAWQQILVFEHFRPGEVNRAVETAACASGKVLNVGSALHHLGAAALTLSPMGGLSGCQIQDDFRNLGVPAQWLTTAAATRTCTTLLDQQTGLTTELVENSAALTSTELEAYARAYQTAVATADWVVLSGSLPSETPRGFYAQLLAQTKVPALLDARGPELQHCLRFRPWLVKPNREELEATYGRPLQTEGDLMQAIRALIEAGAQHVVVSDGAGALYAGNAQGIERFPTLRVPTVNPIGCGDSLAAGLVVAAAEGRPWPAIVEFGIAAAAENATRLLPARFPRLAVERRLTAVT